MLVNWVMVLGTYGGAVAIPMRLHGGPVGYALCVLVVVLGRPVHILAHEVGHLTTAFLLRLPVTEFSAGGDQWTPGRTWGRVTVRLGLGGTVHRIRTAPMPDGRLLPIRMVAMIVSGPVANLALAAVAVLVSRRAGLPIAGRAALLEGAVVGALIGLGNLVPYRPGPGRLSDGANALHWILRPGRSRGAVAKNRDIDRVRAHQQAYAAGRPVDRDELRTLMESADPAVAGLAALVLTGVDTRLGDAELFADAARLRAVALAPGTDRTVTVRILSPLVWVLIGEIFREVAGRPLDAEGKREPDPALVADGVQLAEAGFAADPGEVPMRSALALLRILQDRPAAARDLVLKADLADAQPAARVGALSVRAIAECELGDLAQARRLVEAAAQGRDGYAFRLATRVLAAQEQPPPAAKKQPPPAAKEQPPAAKEQPPAAKEQLPPAAKEQPPAAAHESPVPAAE